MGCVVLEIYNCKNENNAKKLDLQNLFNSLYSFNDKIFLICSKLCSSSYLLNLLSFFGNTKHYDNVPAFEFLVLFYGMPCYVLEGSLIILQGMLFNFMQCYTGLFEDYIETRPLVVKATSVRINVQKISKPVTL